MPNQIANLTIHLKKLMILDNVIDQLPLDDIELIIPYPLVPQNWDIHSDVGLACSHEHQVGVISMALEDIFQYSDWRVDEVYIQLPTHILIFIFIYL